MFEMDNQACHVLAFHQCECVRVCDVQPYGLIMLSCQQLCEQVNWYMECSVNQD